MSKIGVALAGCGVKDGSEIHEAVLTLLALSKAGAQYVCMAPNIEQANVINHLTGHVSPSEKRNVLVESARIARGEIQDMKNVKAADLDGLVFPGGYGAVKNLSDFAAKSENASANPESARLVREMVKAGKPVAFLCIAPAVCAAIFRGSDMHAELTIGSDAQTASDWKKWARVIANAPSETLPVQTEHFVHARLHAPQHCGSVRRREKPSRSSSNFAPSAKKCENRRTRRC